MGPKPYFDAYPYGQTPEVGMDEILWESLPAKVVLFLHFRWANVDGANSLSLVQTSPLFLLTESSAIYLHGGKDIA